MCLEVTDDYVEIFRETFPDMIQKLTGLQASYCSNLLERIICETLKVQLNNSITVFLLQIEPEDGLPTTSCLQCHQEVKSAMLTRYQILNAHKILMDEVKFNVEKYVEYVLNTPPAKTCDTKESTPITETSPKPNKTEPCEDLSHTKNEPSDPQLVQVSSIDSNKPDEVTKNLKGALSRRRPTNKEIKFRKKKANRQKSAEEKIEFKRKGRGPLLSIKMQYEIKPEHQEFLKTVNRKERVACPDCGRVLFGMNMKNHLITHNYDPVVCDICGKTSKNAQVN